MAPTHGWFEKKSEAQKEMERRERLRAAEEAEREAKRQEEEEEKRAHASGMSLAESRRLSTRVCEVLEEYAEAYLRPNLRHADRYSYEVRNQTHFGDKGYQWAIVLLEGGSWDRTRVQVNYSEGMLLMSRSPREQLDLEEHLGLEALAHALHRATRLRVKVSVYWPGPWSFHRRPDPGLGEPFSYIIPDEGYPEGDPVYD
jgi:hypothetical protein